jgi:hypothetical protein
MEYLKINFLVVLIVVVGHWVYSQEKGTYSIRGQVIDEITQQTLPGALVYVINYENNAATTDEDGSFIIERLSVGRHQLNVTYLGYQTYNLVIEVKSGKELVLNIQMKEDIKALDEVVITSKADKSKTVNSLAYASTRTFSVEESSKFAGAVDDPARMAQSFAGVVPTNDGSNYVSIRGNHPSGLLYRAEGIDIPNPNHFGDVASSGGGVSVLSSQVLSNSDFSTGAFSAEYGNALGGVFDIKLRKGNDSKREYTFKAGFLGLEAAVEGPFSKKYKGSYLINYRYSTLSLISKLGVDLTGVLDYSDLSYNIYLPLHKGGNLSLFGINGWSNQNIEETLEDIDKTKGALEHRSDGRFLSNMSVNGAKYTLTTKNNGFLSAVFAYGATKSGFTDDTKTVFSNYTYQSRFEIENLTDKVSGAVHYSKKISPRITLRSGGYFDRLGYTMLYNDYKNGNAPINIINNNDHTMMARAYSQVQYRINEKWSANAGFHYTHFMLNNKQVIEPRGNIQYSFSDISNLALAYGRHSQTQPLIVYFIKSEEGGLVNKNLDFTKAHHIVLTHNLDINTHTRLKTEMYYQHLTDIPVGTDENRNYAMINQQFFFPDFKLVNEGQGRNIGIELTLERFMHNNWYYLMTGSLFDSKYKTPSLDWTNTRFNSGFTSVVTVGKEWIVGKSGRNILGFNLKNAWVGGQYDTPIDRASSQTQQKEVRDESNPFSVKLKDFYKLDVGIKYKRNKNKYTSTLSLDLMNATNNKNIGGLTYDIANDKLEEWTMMPFVPVLSYKVEF